MASTFVTAAYAVLAVATVAGLLAYPSLPERMAVHFGVGGQPDGYAPRLFGVLVVPVVGLVVLGVMQQVSTPADPIPDAFLLALAAFLAYVHGVVLAWNLGYRFNVLYAILPVTGVFLVVTFSLVGLL
ncbi:DUF1648 domain-containing protein [Halogeometricum limi]|uniref:DUF1648 domain-containing protein n=1 Tax=Halogeometricum limi TaxID=555875 RepID=A0A1I6GM54_9EURY|nr:DUF1648 domain-containing protein [Halogeometricum limi]SFR43258.1 Protein of unknown function [Halogeometricum limi]